MDTWEPVYVPLHISVAGDAGHSQGTFERVTPCLLPERGSLLRVVMSSPRYWPQVRIDPTVSTRCHMLVMRIEAGLWKAEGRSRASYEHTGLDYRVRSSMNRLRSVTA